MRLASAIFAKAYQDPELLQVQIEEANLEMRNVISAMAMAAPDFAKARETKGYGGGVDLVRPLVDAARLLRKAKRENSDIETVLAQTDFVEGARPEETETMARFLGQNAKSPKRMGIALNNENKINETIFHFCRHRFGARVSPWDQPLCVSIRTRSIPQCLVRAPPVICGFAFESPRAPQSKQRALKPYFCT